MTYDELAERLGIVRESARQRAKRQGWPRRKTNAGVTQVGVPAEALEILGPDQGLEPDDGRKSDQEPDGYAARYIEKLEAALAEAQAKVQALEQEQGAVRQIERERDAVRAQVEALNTVLIIERERATEWKAVADRFASQAEALAARRGLWGWLRRA